MKKMNRRRMASAALVLALCFLSGCSNAVKDGAKLLEEGNYEEAVTMFEQVTADEDASSAQLAEAYRGLGLASYELKQYDRVAGYMEKALEAGGEETPTLYNLTGISAMRQEEYETALDAFEKGIGLYELKDKSGTDWQKKSSETDYQEVLREMKFNRIICYEKLYNWEQAKNAVEEYLEEYPDDEAAQHEAAFLAVAGDTSVEPPVQKTE